MANEEHFSVLKQGTTAWNTWRNQHPPLQPDLSDTDLSDTTLNDADLSDADLTSANLGGADLSNTNLTGADLTSADLTGANLTGADLSNANLVLAYLTSANLTGADLSNANLGSADLSGANLTGANLGGADLSGTNLSNADLGNANLFAANLVLANLTGANLGGANLTGADLSNANLFAANLGGANLSNANLGGANLVGTNLREATLTECRIYGVSVWNINLTGALQNNLVITPEDEASITVDNLKIAQFLYLLLNNQEIRAVINTITTKVVLILGCFTPERKAALDAIKNELRTHNYVPILFDFDHPGSRDITETVTTLARLARFIIADLTGAKSIPQELAFIVPAFPSVPIQPLLLRSQREYGMFEHFTKFPWVLPVYKYSDLSHLLTSFKKQVIDPAERKAQELTKP
jgi:uncharacterized protein YjbI with pentapeptide repeats